MSDLKMEQKTTESSPTDEPGVAKIKTEFLLLDYKPTVDTEYVSDVVKDRLKGPDAAENNGGDNDGEPPSKKIKLTGRNKKRPKGKRVEASEKICPAIVRDQICSYGDKCKFSHDKSKFMETKLPDISDQCYMFSTYGKCPFGLSCRFGSGHITTELKNIVKEDFDEEKLNASVKNVLKKENQFLLWKRKYDFSKANKIIDEMGCRNPREKHSNKGVNKDKHKEIMSDKIDEVLDPAITSVSQKEGSTCIGKNDISDNNLDTSSNTANSENVADGIRDKVEMDANGGDKVDCISVNKTENAVVQSSEEKAGVKLRDDGNAVGCGDVVGTSATYTASKPQLPSVKALQENKSDKILQENFPSIVAGTSSLQSGEVVDSSHNNVNVDSGNNIDNSEGVIQLRPQEKKKVDFADKLYLAPLTTVGNLPFRRICKRFGADVTCGEMALATNLLQGQASEWALLKRHPSEDLFGVQICGAFPDSMTRCAQIINDTMEVDFVDINCGCPIDLIFNKGEGSALMGKVSKLGQIVKGMTSVLDVPLTVKVRTGIYSDKNMAHTLVPKLRDWGVALTTVHGRSRMQRYTKNADWDYISECARLAAPMPVFGNGDILSFVEANERREQTGVSGLMIARGALIKPWIFTEIKEQRHWDISASERFDILRDYTNYGLEHWGSDQQGVESTRRFLLEWLSFLYRYIPVGLLERLPQKINERPPYYRGRNDLETLMASPNCGDWIKISEMLLGPVPHGFSFLPKHKANAYK